MENQQEKQQPKKQNSNKKKPPLPVGIRKCCPYSKPKGDRSFLEGCLFALCCCWICDLCFDTTVVIG
ncbi:hypothetical protein MANES_11G003500v8 [Manihot esculenta]|uniref:Uncharacterized protein n=1 Tax=Manihot esculenta TaxID=3983 RepID=A0A2C9UYA0_MANES|nr:hypothetical protein MANES_11G003500v8 [Manihot esculenta]